MTERHVIPAGEGRGLRLARGQVLRIVDVEGGQTGDLLAYAPDASQRLSNGRTFDYQGTIYLSTGDVLWSDRSERMLTIVADAAGRHDFLYASCSLEMYRLQYAETGERANCADSLRQAFRELGLEPDPLPTSFNFFMSVAVGPDGRLSMQPPRSRAGDALELRAEMDLAVALTACPASSCNGGAPPRPLAYEIVAG
jgi:uncharacterized protein YcgI (DUF1989 family)